MSTHEVVLGCRRWIVSIAGDGLVIIWDSSEDLKVSVKLSSKKKKKIVGPFVFFPYGIKANILIPKKSMLLYIF